MRRLWKRLREKEGQSLVEYALILALVAIVVIAALSTLGQQASQKFEEVNNVLKQAT